MKVGVIVWVEGIIVKFRIREGIRVERGDLLKVVDGNTIYVLKVFDFKPESLLTAVEVARLSHRRSNDQSLEIFDRPLRYYDTALAQLIAEIGADGRARRPVSVPHLFTEVETLTKQELRALNLDNGDIELGYVRMGRKVTNFRVTISGERAFPHHILITSITGGGKTNLGKVLAWNILHSDNKYSLILIDTENEYFDGGDVDHLGLVHSPNSEKKLLYVTNVVERPCKYEYRFSYRGIIFRRIVNAYPLKIAYDELHPEDFIETGEFSPQQEAFLWLLWRRLQESWLERLVKERVEVLYSLLNRDVPKNTITATKRKIAYMLGDRVFTPEARYDVIGAILKAVASGSVILVDMPFATEAQEKLLAVLLARRVFRFYEGMRKREPISWKDMPIVLIMVEEAHRYLSKAALIRRGERRDNIFSTISKRGRKYKIGLCTITQMPGDLEETIIRQQLTKIVLPLPTRPDFMKVVNYTPYLDGFEEEIKNLDRGEGLLISPPSGMKFAVPFKVHSYEELVRRELNKELALVRSRLRVKKAYSRLYEGGYA